MELPITQLNPENVFATPRQRMEYVETVRERVHREKERVKALHRSGASGTEVTGLLTLFADQVVTEIFSLAVRHHGYSPDGIDLPLALVATGGYGRGELCPYSDVDILFLRRPSSVSLEDIVNEILTLLWDSRFQVGHSVRTIPECISLGRKDLSARTAMLEGRYLAGSHALYGDFQQAFRKQVIEKAVDAFIRQRIEGRDRRYKRHENLVTLLEPNVKEGVGGLRDYHLALWLATARFGFSTLDDCYGAGLIDAEAYKVTREAYNFLLKVRNELHYLQEAREDVLAVELQRRVADHLGFEDQGPRLAVERLMQDYYHQASRIKQFSELLLSRCQPPKKGLTKVWERVKSKDLGDGFVSREGELHMNHVAAMQIEDRPIHMLRAFELCQKNNLLPHESLRGLIRRHLGLIDDRFRRDTEVRSIFYGLLDNDGAERVLRSMHEVGLLGVILPEYGDLTFLPQYDVFHRYTADEHTLQAVRNLEELKDATSSSLQELRAIYRGLERPSVLKMALLLHDIGKSEGAAGHIERGVEIAREVLDRWPMGEKAAQQVIFLVANHLLMNRTAQRRDMHEERLVKDFCDSVGSLENLKLLYLLTYADISAVAPEAWTAWKGALLWDLYHRAKDYLTHEPEERLTGEALLERLRELVARELAYDVSPEAIEAYFQAMPYKYVASTPPDRIVLHIQLAEKMIAQEGLAMEHWHNQQFGYSEVLVCTTGRTGILSEIAGALTSKNINILGAQVFTRQDNIAIDTLQVNRLEGGCVTDESVWQALEGNLRDMIAGKETVEALLSRRTQYVTDKRFVGRPVGARVEINNRISDTHTVIEMKARDRLGLLYLVTREMVKLNLDIYLAKISTEASRAINVFYVTDLDEEKIFDDTRIAHIRETLLGVLEKGEIA